jgi:hypothetical protein
VAELSERRTQIAQQCRALDREQELQQRLRQQRTKAEEVLLNLETFADRVRLRLTEADFTEKQAILQLVIEHVIVGEDTLEIRHVIRLRSPVPDPGGHPPPGVPLRSDGVHIAPLPDGLGQLGQHLLNGSPQPGMIIAHDKLDTCKDRCRRLTSRSFQLDRLSRLAISTARMFRRPSQLMPIAINTAWLRTAPSSCTFS